MIDRRTLLGAFGAASVLSTTSMSTSPASAVVPPPVSDGGLIDVHSHFLPDFYREEALASGITFPDGMPAWPSWSVETQLRMMDSSGIELAVMSMSSPSVNFGDKSQSADLARRVNDFASRTTSDVARLGFFATLPLPNIVESTTEAIRALDQLGADGVAMMSNASGVYPGNLAWSPLLSALDARSAVVLLHPTSPPNTSAVTLGRPAPMIEFLFDSARAVVDLLFQGAFDRYPNIRWVITHGGGVLPLLADRVDLFRGQVGPDNPTATELLGRLWFDLAGTPTPRQLPALGSIAGSRQILYGSDYCFTPVAAVEKQIASLDAAPSIESADNWRLLTSDNARRLLGL